MLTFPHDLMLMVHAHLSKLRESVVSNPIATVFGGDDDIALCIMRVNSQLVRGFMHAPNLLAVALDSPDPVDMPEAVDVPDSELVQEAEACVRELIANPDASAGLSFRVIGAREVAIGIVLRVDPEDDSAIDVVLSGIQGMHEDLAAGMGGTSSLHIERL